MTICAVPGCQSHYGCKIKNKGIQVSPSVHVAHGGNWRPTRTPPNTRRGAIVYDHRTGGTKVPILKEDGTPLRQFELEKDRHKFTDVMRSKAAAVTT